MRFFSRRLGNLSPKPLKQDRAPLGPFFTCSVLESGHPQPSMTPSPTTTTTPQRPKLPNRPFVTQHLARKSLQNKGINPQFAKSTQLCPSTTRSSDSKQQLRSSDSKEQFWTEFQPPACWNQGGGDPGIPKILSSAQQSQMCGFFFLAQRRF